MDRVKRLVAELDASRSAPLQVHDRLCATIARELSQLRQRALTADIGALDELAGSLAVVAKSGVGVILKSRALSEGVSSLSAELDLALRRATASGPTDAGGKA